MRTAFSASALLLALFLHAPARAVEPVALATSASSNHSARNATTRLEIRTQAGTRHALWLKRDATVSAKAKPTTLEVIGEVKGMAVVLVDTYPSIAGGLSYCQAGEERFLRVVSIEKNPPRETFRVKLASCRDNIELAAPGIEWLPESATLRIRWLQGAAPKGLPEESSLVIGRDGKPTRFP